MPAPLGESPWTPNARRHSRTAAHPAFSEVEGPAGELIQELARAWRAGERPLAEDFLARHPQLREQPEVAVRLIYEEICLREELGEEKPATEVVRRFPQWEKELRFLLHCHELLRADLDPPSFPEVGETLGDFQLLAELGRGALGRVFLATQPSLASRPIVLKLTPRDGQEHLSLARLQHTHIVPLYEVQDFPSRNLRALCMSYLGGATLAQLVEQFRERPMEARTGLLLLQSLDDLQSRSQISVSTRGPARKFFARVSYVEALCWIGTCLAEALQYAHERDLVHLDLKPSNVLLTAEAQPMLLDFHLAREPIEAHGPLPEWIGGTPGYMSPEQRAALEAVRDGKPIAEAVDGRSDVYSLGLVLYEALGGLIPTSSADGVPRLERENPLVSVGLADIIHKCLAPRPEDRYTDAATLSADLRRHLGNLPLLGVPNRSWSERWQKWRRRRPHALATVYLVAIILVFLGLGGTVSFLHYNQRLDEARASLVDSQELLRQREYGRAQRSLIRGLALVEGLPGTGFIRDELATELQLANRAQAAQELHAVANRLRFHFDLTALPPRDLRVLEASCRAAWNSRAELLQHAAAHLAPDLEARLTNDLLELAVLGANLRVRLSPRGQTTEARKQALRTLDEIEGLLGPSAVLYRERQVHAAALGLKETAEKAAREAARQLPRTAWEHHTLGLFLLGTGNLPAAAAEFEQALRLQPQGFWSNFYQGVCAHRLGHHEEALAAFHVCVALAPETAECFYNRGRAQHALGRLDKALRDYDRAVEIDSSLAAAFFNRGILHYREKRYTDAAADLHRALEQGAEPTATFYHLALVYRARGDRTAALKSVRQALEHDPTHQESRALQERLQREP